jgi:uncharacterized delta-60 repeat protein
MRRILLLCGLVPLLLSLSAGLGAAPGVLDRSFGAGFGYVRYADATATVPDQGWAAAVQADGKLVVAGASGISPGVVVLRYNVDGTLDDGFADHGVFRWKQDAEVSSARRVVPLADGRLYVFGYTFDATTLWLARLEADGSLDASFGTGGVLRLRDPGWIGDPRRIVIDAVGYPIIVWEAADAATNRFRLTRYRPDGSRDTGYLFGAGEIIVDTGSIGAQTTLPFTAFIEPTGELLVAASAYNASYNTTLLYRFQHGTGQPDPKFGTGGMIAIPQQASAFYGRQWTIVADNGHGFVLVEWRADGIRLQKFDLDGNVVTSFGNRGSAFFQPEGGVAAPGNAVVTADGAILVTGTRQPAQYSEIFLLGVTADGALDARLGSGVPQRVYRGEDTNQPGGMVAADIVRTGSGFAIAGSAASDAGADDILVLALDATGRRNGAFAGNGRATWSGGDLVPEAAVGIWRQPGGKLLLLDRTAGGSNFRRLLADGSVDKSFASAGKRALAEDWSGPNVAILTQADGAIVLARQVNGPGFNNTTKLVRYRIDGTVDNQFGGTGAVRIVDADVNASQSDAVRPGLAQTDDGKLLVATFGTDGLRLRRFLATGAPDTDFGNGTGVVYPPLHGRPRVGYAMAVQSDGRIVLGAGATVIAQLPLPQHEVDSDVLVRLMPDGALDPTFGLRGGIVPIQIENARDPQIVRVLPLPDGKVLVAGNITRFGGQQFFFMRMNGDGTPDTTLGDHTDAGDGPGSFIWSDPYQTGLRDIAIDAAGRLVITGDYALGTDRSTAFVVRFLADGTTDGAFAGLNQRIFLFDRPEAANAGNALALDTNAIVVAGSNGPRGLVFKLEADGTARALSQSVFEFFNTGLQHYFVTADPDEAAAIDRGAAGPGWERTGRGFRAWVQAAGVPNEALPVCRFYGTPGVGPNSHFYTVVPLECDAVRQDPGWRYEGIAFYSVPPDALGCPAAMRPVYRLYNNGYASNDSNHRYTTDPALYQGMQNKGWTGEGVVFCSPTF